MGATPHSDTVTIPLAHSDLVTLHPTDVLSKCDDHPARGVRYASTQGKTDQNGVERTQTIRVEVVFIEL